MRAALLGFVLLAVLAVWWKFVYRPKVTPDGVVLARDGDEVECDAPEQRLVRVRIAQLDKTYTLDLNRVVTSDLLEPVPLADGRNPFAERFQKLNEGPKIDFPEWLKPPAGAERRLLEQRPDTKWFGASVSATYTAVPAKALEAYRIAGERAGFVLSEESAIGEMRSLGLRSRDGKAHAHLSAYAEGELHVHYRLDKEPAGCGPDDLFPKLDMDHFDEDGQKLYLVDRESGQHFSLTAEQVGHLDERLDSQVETARAKLPEWFRHYPGAQVETSFGPVTIDGEQHHEQDSEHVTVKAGFDEVWAHYRGLLESRAEGRVVGRSKGDEYRRSRRRFESLTIEGAEGSLSVSVQELAKGVEAQVQLLHRRPAER